ncbi:MAG: FmdC precursor [Cyclobacteriaceae bacterium]
MKTVISLITLLTLIVTEAQEISNNRFGKGVQVMAKDSSFFVKGSFRFQTLYDGQTTLGSGEWSDKMMIRRSRVKMEGYVYDPRFSFKAELAVSNRDNGKVANETNRAANIVLDAVMKYKFDRNNMELWIGQTKLPGNRERVISSQKLQFVDRSQLNSKFTIDRGTGVQFRNKSKTAFGVIKQQAAISLGEGRNVTASNVGGYEYTGRLEYLPFGEFASKGDYFGSDLKREPKPKLAIGFTWDENIGASKEQGFKGDYIQELQNLQTIYIDAMFKFKGFSSMLELAERKVINGNPVGTDEVGNPIAFITGTAGNLQAGYLFKNNYEIAARFTGIRPENNNWSDDYNVMTLGFSKYIVGHNLKFQSDVSLINNDQSDDQFRFRFQAELAF